MRMTKHRVRRRERGLVGLLLVSALALMGADIDETKETTESAIQHAKTYYWLARERGSAAYELTKAADWAMVARTKARTRSQQLRGAAEEHLMSARAQLELAKMRFGSALPAVRALKAKDEGLVHKQQPSTVAAVRAVRSLIETFSRTILRRGQPYVLIISRPNDRLAEEAVNAWFATKDEYYPISALELGELLSADERQILTSKQISPELMTTIAEEHDQSYLWLVELQQNDVVDEIHYWGVTMTAFDVENGEFGPPMYADGFAEDVSLRRSFFNASVLIILLLSIIYGILSRKLLKPKTAAGRRAPIWFEPICVLVGAVSAFLVSKVLVTFMPKAGTIFPGGLSVAWLFGLALAFTIVPIAISYVVALRITPVTPFLRSPDTLASLTFSSLLGGLTYFASKAFVRLPPDFGIEPATAWLIMTTFTAIIVGSGFSRILLDRDRLGFIRVVGQLVAQATGVFFLLIWSDLTTTIGLATFSVLSVVAFAFPSRLIIRLMRMNATHSTGQGLEVKQGALERLHDANLKPAFVAWPSRVTNELLDFMAQGDEKAAMKVVLVEGELGTGRGRLVSEACIQFDNQNPEAKVSVLSGSCSELPDPESERPYEALAQAFGDYLNVTRLHSPSDLEAGVLNTLSGAGVQTVLSAVGLGPIVRLVKPESITNESSNEATQTAIASALEGVIRQLTRVRDVVLVVREAQWIDKRTLGLFKRLLDTLAGTFIEHQFIVVVTTQPGEEGPSKRGTEISNLVHDMANAGQFKLHTIGPKQFTADPFFIRNFLRALALDHKDVMTLEHYLSEKELTSPLSIIQAVRYLARQKYIVGSEAQLALAPGVDLSQLRVSVDAVKRADDQLSELNGDLIAILECAALIGRRFRANMLAEIFKMDEIVLLDRLRQAEAAGIVKDLVDEDQVFVFVSAHHVSALLDRLLARGVEERTDWLTQLAREYQLRYLNIVESDLAHRFGELKAAPAARLSALASRAHRVRHAIPEKALTLLSAAAVSQFEMSNFSDANTHFAQAWQLAERQKAFPDSQRAELGLRYIHSLLESDADRTQVAQLIESLEKSGAVMGESVGRLGVFKARLYYERREWSLAIEAADTVMADTKASEMDQIRALMLKALSLSPADIDRLTLLETAETKLDDPVTIIEDSNRQLLKGEVLNNLGREYMRHRPEKAEATLQKAYQLNRDSGARSLRSRAISAGALGDLYHFASGVPRNADIARSYYEENLQLSRNMGDLAGLIRMTSLLGQLALERQDIDLAQQFYSESLYRSYGRSASDPRMLTNSTFALAGLLNVAAQQTGPEQTAALDLVTEPLQQTILRIQDGGAPSFAVQALVDALAPFESESLQRLKDTLSASLPTP